MRKKNGSGRGKWKIAAFFLAIALGLGGAWHFMRGGGSASRQRLKADSLVKAAGETEDVVDLAIKSISLSQGEGGFELWRLKAEWANLRKRDDTVMVEQPRLAYNMREEGKVLHVASRSGDINQKTQILRFIDDVRVTQESKILTGDLLVYDGGAKTMTFPHGGAFKDTGISGSVDVLVWHINRQAVTGEGNVQVLLEGPSKPGGSTPETRRANGNGRKIP